MTKQIAESSIQPAWFINVRARGVPTDLEDQTVAGMYTADFVRDITTLSRDQIASMVLDNFHEQIAIGTLDEFLINVMDDSGELVIEDDEHESYSSAKFSVVVDKISDVALYVELEHDCRVLETMVTAGISAAVEGTAQAHVSDASDLLADFVVSDLFNYAKSLQTEWFSMINRQRNMQSYIQTVARMHIWNYARKDGQRYDECDAPADGAMDSHLTLMNLIETARSLA